MKGRRKPVVSVQFPDGGAKRLRDHYHRMEAESSSAEDLHTALDATARGLVHKSPFKGRKPAMKPDEEAGIKEAVSAIADGAFT